MADRPDRPCIACQQVDTHPRCQVGLPDGSSIFFHIDCHAKATPACPNCVSIVADLEQREAIAEATGGDVGPNFLTLTSKES